jgi:hypothetical protein
MTTAATTTMQTTKEKEDEMPIAQLLKKKASVTAPAWIRKQQHQLKARREEQEQ